MKSKHRKPDLAVALVTCLFFYGAILTSFAVAAIVQARGASKWSRTEGYITEVRIVRDTWFQTRLGLGGGLLGEVKYTYKADGQEYASTRIAFKADRIGAEVYRYSPEVARMYYVGQPVDVKFDPQCPTEAVLLTRPAQGVWSRLVIGMLLCAPVLLRCCLRMFRDKMI